MKIVLVHPTIVENLFPAPLNTYWLPKHMNFIKHLSQLQWNKLQSGQEIVFFTIISFLFFSFLVVSDNNF
jgi:hypothetical protein